MEKISVITVFILSWIWIELIFLFSSKISKKEIAHKKISFIWYLRAIALILLVLSFYLIENVISLTLQDALKYCIGLVN